MLLELWYTTQGAQGVLRFKACCSRGIRVIMGQKGINISGRKKQYCWRWVYKYSNKPFKYRLFAITILSFYRVCYCKPVYDLSSIINKGNWDPNLCIEFIKDMCKLDLKSIVLRSKMKRKGRFHLLPSEKSGVNGNPAFLTYREDLKGLLTSSCWFAFLYFLYMELNSNPRVVMTSHMRLIIDILKEWLGCLWFLKLLLPSFIIRYFWARGVKESRISFISDIGGKTRVIAIGDIWTQSLLRPIHDFMFSVLRTLNTDGTFDQDKQRNKVKEWTKQKRKLYSLDLSSATDRLPVWVQAVCMYASGYLGFVGMICWYNLMVNRDFYITAPKKVLDKIGLDRVRYSVGQPMGIISSWSSLAWFHHVVVWVSAYRSGFKRPTRFSDYCILGDDIVIANTTVAKHYTFIMNNVLGVQISVEKSFISKGKAEFAKSLYYEGMDLTPISPRILTLERQFYHSFVIILLNQLATRGVPLTLSFFLKNLPKFRKNEIFALVTCPLSGFHFDVGIWDFMNLYPKQELKAFIDDFSALRSASSIDSRVLKDAERNIQHLLSLHNIADPIMKMSCPLRRKASNMSRSISMFWPLIWEDHSPEFWTFAMGSNFLTYPSEIDPSVLHKFQPQLTLQLESDQKKLFKELMLLPKNKLMVWKLCQSEGSSPIDPYIFQFYGSDEPVSLGTKLDTRFERI